MYEKNRTCDMKLFGFRHLFVEAIYNGLNNKTDRQVFIWYGDMLFSEYKASNGTRFWIITESYRTYTIVLLPEDY